MKKKYISFVAKTESNNCLRCAKGMVLGCDAEAGSIMEQWSVCRLSKSNGIKPETMNDVVLKTIYDSICISTTKDWKPRQIQNIETR